MKDRTYGWMHKLTAVVLLFALLLSLPVASALQVQAASSDGILNSEFDDRYFWGSVKEWTAETRQDTKWYASNEGYEDSFSIQCVKTGANGHGYGVLQSNEFNVIAGQQYKLTYLSRLTDQVGNVYIVAQIIFYDATGTVIERQRSKEFDHRTNSEEWLAQQGYFTAPENAVSGKVEFLTCGTSYKCWIDQVVWQKCDANDEYWGFEMTDSYGNIAGWSSSAPANTIADSNVYYNGSQSVYVNQTTTNAKWLLTSDTLIPINAKTRYLFSIYMKSSSCDIASDGVRLNMLTYDADGVYVSTIEGIRSSLSAGAESDWRELVCGVYADKGIAYVRPQLTVSAGIMNFWVDGLSWKLYDGNAFTEDFKNVTSENAPAGWDCIAVSGEPTFSANGESVVIETQSGAQGYVSRMWKLATEKTDHSIAVKYQTTGSASAWVRIRYFDYKGAELTKQLYKTLNGTNGVWKTATYSFTVPSATYALVEFGSGEDGTAVCDSIYIKQTGNRETTDIPNTVWIPDDSPLPTAKFQDVNGTQTLFVNGQAIANMTYIVPDLQSYMNEETDNAMHEAGICVTRVRTNPAAANVWIGPGQYDFSDIDTRVYNVLNNHADTYLMIQVVLDVPQWWKDANPEELMVSSEENGSKNNVSLASQKFADDAIAVNIAMLEHIAAQPYANRVVGAVLCAGQTKEWIWFDLGQYAVDYSSASQTAFRAYLTQVYETDTALQQAWGDPNVTLATAEVPALDDRMSQQYTTLLTPEDNRSTLDYHNFMADVNVKLLNRLADAVTESVDDRWVLGVYYGYINNTYYYGNANGTMHIAVEQALENENLDFFASPVLYNERYDGESGGNMQMIDSILAHGKAVMVENDNRLCSYVDLNTNFYTRDAVGPTYTVWDSVSQIERDFASQITQQTGLWWLNMWGNFFLNEQFTDLIGQMYQEMKLNMDRPSAYQKEVCYIIDEDMYTYLAYNGFDSNYDVLYSLLYEQRQELAKIGVSYDTYYMSDLTKGLIPDYKVYMLIAPVEMDEAERQAVETYLKKDGKTVIWQYISGASDGTTFSAANMSDAIGMDVELISDTRKLQAQFGNTENAIVAGAQGDYYGSSSGKNVVSPIAVVNDIDATILASMVGTGEGAFAVKNMGNWTSIYSAVPCIPAQVLRNILEMQDVHIYCDDPDSVIFASDKYVAINCAYGGEKTITLNANYSVYEVYTQKVIASNTNTIVVNMEDNSTRLFRLMAPGTYGIFTEVSEGGTTEAIGYQEFAAGNTATIVFDAQPGNRLQSITVDGVEKVVTGTSYALTIPNLSNCHWVSATFAPAENADVEGYTVSIYETFEYADEGATFAGEGSKFDWTEGSVNLNLIDDSTSNWTGSYQSVVAEATGKDGSDQVLRFSRTGAGYGNISSPVFQVAQGTHYRFSFDYKTEQVTYKPGCTPEELGSNKASATYYGLKAYIRWFDQNGNQIGQTVLNNNQAVARIDAYTPDYEWGSLAYDFTPIDGAVTAKIYFAMGAQPNLQTADVLLDNIFVGQYNQEIVVNGDFEGTVFEALGGRDANTAGPGLWELVSVNTSGVLGDSNNWQKNYIAQTETVNGDNVLKLTPKSTTQGYAVALSQFIRVDAGQKYVLSYKQMLKNAENETSHGARTYVYYYDDAHNLLSTKFYIMTSKGISCDWTVRNHELTVPSGATYAKVGFFIGGTWNVSSGFAYYYDNVSFEKPEMKIKQWNLSLGDDIGLNFYVQISDSLAENAVMHITVDGKTTSASAKDVEKSEDGCYIFKANVAAAQMTTPIELNLVSGSYSVSGSYTVRQYADVILAGEYSNTTKALVQKMLRYGGKAQSYFGYNTGDMADKDISQTTAQVPADTVNVEVTGKANGIAFYGASLLFESKTAVRYYFSTNGNIADYTFTVAGQTYTPVKKDGLYYVDVDGINPQDLDTAITVQVTDGTHVLSVTYNPMSYIIRMYNGKGSESMKALLQAMYGYHLAAKDYVKA